MKIEQRNEHIQTHQNTQEKTAVGKELKIISPLFHSFYKRNAERERKTSKQKSWGGEDSRKKK